MQSHRKTISLFLEPRALMVLDLPSFMYTLLASNANADLEQKTNAVNLLLMELGDRVATSRYFNVFNPIIRLRDQRCTFTGISLGELIDNELTISDEARAELNRFFATIMTKNGWVQWFPHQIPDLRTAMKIVQNWRLKPFLRFVL